MTRSLPVRRGRHRRGDASGGCRLTRWRVRALTGALDPAGAVLTDRPRPQATLTSILKPPGADWAQASYPSGHATVTTAMAAAAAFALPVLRGPMAGLAVVIAWSRVAFGAHFPLDVLAAAALGYASAAFSVRLATCVGLLPGPDTRRGAQPAR